MLFSSLLITAGAAVLIQLVFHLATIVYFPHLDNLSRYILGTIGMALPLTALYAQAGDREAIYGLWTVVTGSGIAVIAAYRFRALWLEYIEGREALQREQHAETDEGE